jgi:cellulose biosynthesis protein BcsQ
MKTLAIYSNKGGVGKTAAAVNLSYLAAQSGLTTLVVDLDPQSSTSFYFRVKPKLKRGARGLAKGGKAIDRSIKGTDFEGLDLLPADFSHRRLDLVLNQFKRPEKRLDKVITPLQDEYDLVIFDCPPAINILAENVFYAADFILVPLIPTTLSERTHKILLSFFKKEGYDLNRVYTFISMVDRRKKLHRDLSVSFRSEFERVLQNAIPYSSDVEKMGLERQPVITLAPRSKATSSYRKLWAEVHQDLLDGRPAPV